MHNSTSAAAASRHNALTSVLSNVLDNGDTCQYYAPPRRTYLLTRSQTPPPPYTTFVTDQSKYQHGRNVKLLSARVRLFCSLLFTVVYVKVKRNISN